MIEIIVFVSGLVLGVPDAGANPKGVTFLLDKGHGMGASGDAIPSHRARIAAGPIAYELVEPARVRIEHKPASGPAGSLTLNEIQHFANLATVVPAGTKVRKACTGDTALSDCTVGGDRVLSSVLRLEGGWSLRAHSRCPVDRAAGAWKIMPGLTDASTYRFVKASEYKKPGEATGEPFRLADTYSFRVSVQQLSEVELWIGANRLPIAEATDSADCKPFGATRCAIVEITNSVAPGHAVHGPDTIDPHLVALYDLLDPVVAAADRSVPLEVSKSNCTGPGGPGDPPYTKCKPSNFWLP